jgi:ubiquinone/menaquinone biosynthesis C-methylase UbiE
MRLSELEKNWEELGKHDPYWAILTDNTKKNNKWKIDEFYETGQQGFDIYWNKTKNFGLNIETGYLLDFGCGVGRLTQAACRYFDKVVGVDVSSSMINLAQKNNKFENKCNYIINKKDDLKIFSDNSFDFILSLLTLQHMDPEYSKKYIGEFIRVLKPQGVILFNIPSEIEGFQNKILEYIIYHINMILNKYFKKPIMEMYGINKNEVEKYILNNNGILIAVEKRKISNWSSYTYWVTKEK